MLSRTLRSATLSSLRHSSARVAALSTEVHEHFHSMLFCPGNKLKVLNKALGLGVDAIIADFEDAVAPSEKAAAREVTSSALRAFKAQQPTPTKPRAAVRINEPGIPEGKADLQFLIDEAKGEGDNSFCCDALVLPKCEDPKAISEVAAQIENKIPIWCMIETSRGVLEAANIAALPEVEGLILGPNDLTKCMQGRQTPTREPLFFAMSTCVTAARAYGKFAVDGVHINIHDSDGFKQSSIQARDFGFDGKSLIHPSQVSIQCVRVTQ